jgi:hypothetical protein
MEAFWREGLRILFFCGGETLLWHDEGRGLFDIVGEAKEMGFPLVNVVTNGTLGARVPGADLVFLSIDGMREGHDAIRGAGTFDTIMRNLEAAKGQNTCVYMAVNRLTSAKSGPWRALSRPTRPSVRFRSTSILPTPAPRISPSTMPSGGKRSPRSAPSCERVCRYSTSPPSSTPSSKIAGRGPAPSAS